jgi:hypothetical protein
MKGQESPIRLLCRHVHLAAQVVTDTRWPIIVTVSSYIRTCQMKSVGSELFNSFTYNRRTQCVTGPAKDHDATAPSTQISLTAALSPAGTSRSSAL